MQQGIPITDRILRWLPGAGWIWVTLWAVLVLIRPVVFAQVLRLTGTPTGTWEFYQPRLAAHAVLAYMVVLCFWAVRRVAGDAAALEPHLNAMAAHPPEAGAIFSGVYSTAGPVLLTGLVTAVTVVNLAWQRGAAAALIFLPYYVLPIVPMMALFWVYLSVLVGLDRLGRRKMDLGPFPEDTSLGLGEVGGRAFHGFLIFCAVTVPFLLVNLRSRFDLILGLTFFVAGVAAFFLSMWRLHRQMVEVKRRHLAWARRLYAEAYEPVRAGATLDAIRERAPFVSTAESLEKRAAMIQEWPFDDRTMARVVAISTGVITAVISRMILRSIGL